MDAITQWDFSVLDAIAARRTPWLDAFFSVFTHLGDAGIVWIVLAVILLSLRRTRPMGLCIAAALVCDLLLCNLCIKPLVARPRPYQLREVTLLIQATADSSFPSGHTAASFAAATVLAVRRSRLAVWALLLAGLIAVSRLYLFVHFPTDVLGGVVIGAACGLFGCYVGDAFWKRLPRRS